MDRKEWALKLMDRDPELTKRLREFNAVFEAKVMHMEHEDPELCWHQGPTLQEMGTWVVPSASWGSNREYASGFKPKKKRRQDD